jgi:hypothetical protein
MLRGVNSDGKYAQMDESWRDLRISDRIRLVTMPSEFAAPGYYVHPCTKRVYVRLIKSPEPDSTNGVAERN